MSWAVSAARQITWRCPEDPALPFISSIPIGDKLWSIGTVSVFPAYSQPDQSNPYQNCHWEWAAAHRMPAWWQQNMSCCPCWWLLRLWLGCFVLAACSLSPFILPVHGLRWALESCRERKLVCVCYAYCLDTRWLRDDLLLCATCRLCSVFLYSCTLILNNRYWEENVCRLKINCCSAFPPTTLTSDIFVFYLFTTFWVFLNCAITWKGNRYRS